MKMAAIMTIVNKMQTLINVNAYFTTENNKKIILTDWCHNKKKWEDSDIILGY